MSLLTSSPNRNHHFPVRCFSMDSSDDSIIFHTNQLPSVIDPASSASLAASPPISPRACAASTRTSKRGSVYASAETISRNAHRKNKFSATARGSNIPELLPNLFSYRAAYFPLADLGSGRLQNYTVNGSYSGSILSDTFSEPQDLPASWVWKISSDENVSV